MFKHNYLPNDKIIHELLYICDIYHHPFFLKATIDNFVLNRKLRLNAENFTYYIQILSNFKEVEEYVHNLISTSNDLGYPVKPEFYEFLIYNNLIAGNVEQVEKYIEAVNKVNKAARRAVAETVELL